MVIAISVVGVPLIAYLYRLWQADRFLDEQRAAVVAAGFFLDPDLMRKEPFDNPEQTSASYERIYSAWKTDIERFQKARSDRDEAKQDALLTTLTPATKELVVVSKLKPYFVRRYYDKVAYMKFPEYQYVSEFAALLDASVRRAMRRGDEAKALDYLEAARRIQHQLCGDWPVLGSLVGIRVGGNPSTIGQIAATTKSPAIRTRCINLLRNPTRIDRQRWIQYELISVNGQAYDPHFASVIGRDPKYNLSQLDLLLMNSAVVKKEATAKALQRLLKLNERLSNEAEAVRLVEQNEDSSLSGRLAYAIFPRYFFQADSSHLLRSRAILVALGEREVPPVPYINSRMEGACFQTNGHSSRICFWTDKTGLRQSRGGVASPVLSW